MTDDVDEMRTQLEHWGHVKELREVHTFRGYRNRQDGYGADLRIEVHDAGPTAGRLRWSAVVMDTEDGREVTGNPGPTIDEALAFIHWQELD